MTIKEPLLESMKFKKPREPDSPDEDADESKADTVVVVTACTGVVVDTVVVLGEAAVIVAQAILCVLEFVMITL